LYGHPDAWGFWEEHCEEGLTAVGFGPIESWKSVFWHPELKLLLVVYVDDFKMGGPKENLRKGWDLIASKIKLELPGPLRRYLGCDHVISRFKHDGLFDPRLGWMNKDKPKKEPPVICEPGTYPKPVEEIVMMKFDVKNFMQQCVDRYLELRKGKFALSLKHADTPYLDEGKHEFDENVGVLPTAIAHLLVEQCAAARTPITAETEKKRNAIMATDADPSPGVLGDVASAVLMKLLYGSRMARFDLLRLIQGLAARITTWTALCGKRLHRLMCYVQSTLDLYMYGWIGDEPKNMELVLYCDADLAGDRMDVKSTSGVLFCLGSQKLHPTGWR
jgi:hypothetical protein